MNIDRMNFWKWVRINHPHILNWYLDEMMEEEE